MREKISNNLHFFLGNILIFRIFFSFLKIVVKYTFKIYHLNHFLSVQFYVTKYIHNVM